MKRQRRIYINSAVLRDYLRDWHISRKELSMVIGHSENYINICLSKGYMEVSSYKFLCATLNVNEERFLAETATATYNADDYETEKEDEVLTVLKEMRDTQLQTLEALEYLSNKMCDLAKRYM